MRDSGRACETPPRRVQAIRRAATLSAVLLAAVASMAAPAPATAHDPPGIERFMRALAAVESNGRYEAVNATSGAYGRYQILPTNWTRWAGQFLDNREAPPTPDNQERVTRAKLTVLYHWLGSWDLVAHWWLTGSPKTDPATFSPFAARYVARVMALYDGSVAFGYGPPDDGRTDLQESEAGVIYGGGWGRAQHGGYAGDTVAYSEVVGASATFAFTGRSVVWIGPMGPTRGRAVVFVDGALARTIDLRAGSFHARNALFTVSWPEAGDHVLRIEVVGEPGRPVAIDEFRVGS